MTDVDVLFAELHGPHGEVGLITLNRPEMLNALTQNMCRDIYGKLREWEKVEDIKAVIICAAAGRAFCAGGDIRAAYEKRNQPDVAQTFFWDEYSLNHAIYHFKKPYIALLDGLTMGGGAGLSVNGRYRVATQKLKFAMPETGIGFFPDVGASYFLTRTPGKLGWYLGLTGTIIDLEDAYYAGLINYAIRSEDISLLIKELVNTIGSGQETVEQVIQKFAMPVSNSQLAQHREVIDDCFSQHSIEEIITRLTHQADAWTHQVVALLNTRSPTSLKIVYEQLRRGSNLDFDDCMRMEYRIASRCLVHSDFYEGIRAAVVDKDRSPHWTPAQLSDVRTSDIASYFSPLGEGNELEV